MANDDKLIEILERYRAGELAGEERERVEQRLLEDPAWARAFGELEADAVLEEQLRDLPGARPPVVPAAVVDGYRVAEEIHRGGQGIVYRAVEEETGRSVALKLLLTGAFASRLERLRFEREIEFAAHLDHPHLVALYRSGTTADGHPYLVMPFIDGDRIDAYVRQNRLDEEQVLDLFRKVARAVHHAHLQGVIHRDLKPGNILVDARGEPKVIDFGIARAQDSSDEPFRTATGQVLGTLGYMAPEQLSGQRVDARCDVYALGVILYQLLCGQLPVDVTDLSLTDTVDRLRNASIRHPSSVKPSLSRDLGWIAMKALERDPEDRYSSVGELAQDVDRYMGSEVVLAGPPSTSYRVRQFVRRHTAVVGFSAAIAVVLIAGTVVSTLGYFEASEQRAAADDQARRAGAVRDFLVKLLQSPAPGVSGRDVKVVDVLSQADAWIARDFANDPESEAELRQALAETYSALGLDLEARHHFAPLLELMRELRPADDELSLQIERMYAVNLRETGEGQESLTRLEDLLSRAQRAFGPDHLETLHTRHSLAATLVTVGRIEEAIEIEREVLADYLARFPDEAKFVQVARQALAWALLSLETPDALVESEALLRENLAIAQRTERSSEALAAMSILTSVLAARRDYAGADKMLDGLAEAYREVYGPDSEETIGLTERRGLLCSSRGQFQAAERLFRDALARFEEKYGDQNATVLRLTNRLANSLAHQGKLAEAVPVAERLTELTDQQLGEDDHRSVIALFNAGMTRMQAGQSSRAIEAFEEVLERGGAEPETHGYPVQLALRKLAEAEFAAGNTDDAEELFREALAVADEWRGPQHLLTIERRRDLGDFLVAAGRPEEGYQELEESFATLERHHPGATNELRMHFESLADACEALEQRERARLWRARITEGG